MGKAEHTARAFVDDHRHADHGLKIGHVRQFAEQQGGRSAGGAFGKNGLPVAEHPAGNTAAHAELQGLPAIQQQAGRFTFHAVDFAGLHHRGKSTVVKACGLDHGAQKVLDEIRPALMTEAQVLYDTKLGKIARNVSRIDALPRAGILLAGHQLGKHLEDFVVLVRKGILALAVHAQRPARGHRAAHEGLDPEFLSLAVVAQGALVLVKIGHDQRLAIANDPAYQPLAGLDDAFFRNAVPQAERGRQAVIFAAFFPVRKKKNSGIGVKHATENAQNMLFKGIVHHEVQMKGLREGPPASKRTALP